MTSGTRTGGRTVWLSVLLVPLLCAALDGSRPRFYPDDPIAREPEPEDASGVGEVDIELLSELSSNLFVISRHEPSNTRAQNINTIDEVPDSSWFTNRAGAAALTPADLVRGPIVGRPPSPERWVITREKSAGAQAGFTAKDANGETWFLTFDMKSNPEGGTAAMVVATKIFWALGYNQIETFLTTFDPARASFDPRATRRRPSGARTPFNRDDLNEVLEHVARRPDGTYRVAAGRLLPGKVLGGFRYAGTRPDDPNDIVPHQHRRELRALRVFGAWTNLTDLKAGNTLDTLVVKDGRAIVMHVLQDVGSTFGMANRPHEWDVGWEHFYEGESSWRRLRSFGFDLSPWQTVPYTEYPSIGRFEGEQFDPRAWKPQTPTLAYMELRADDAFWAARRVMAFDDQLIRAAVHTGEYSNVAAERHLASVLMARRDTIGRTYVTAINPIVDLRLDSGGTLTFQNAAARVSADAADVRYEATWSRFDNATGATARIGETTATTTTMPAPGPLLDEAGSFIEIDIRAVSKAHPEWRRPIRTHFRRTREGWKLVGLERLADTAGTARSSRAAKETQ